MATGANRVPFVDLAPQHREIADELGAAWERVVDSGRYIGGPEVERFESAWASYCGTTEAVSVANGTDALLLTLRALGIGEGDEVIVPANTFIATAEAVVLAGARPRFVDVDPDSLLIDTRIVEAALTPKTAAIMVVHLYGHMPDMDQLTALAQRRGIALIEDAAQAHGATWRGRRAGSFGVAGCFSFYPGKNLGAMGDGGAVVSSDAGLIAKIRELGDHGRSATDRNVHASIGTNSRLDALQAAILSEKLTRLDAWTASRRDLAVRYTENLGAARVVRPIDGCESAHHLFVVRVDDRDARQQQLGLDGIEAGVHYAIPCHQQEPYATFADGPLPNAERASSEILSLPFYPYMDASVVEHVSRALADAEVKV